MNVPAPQVTPSAGEGPARLERLGFEPGQVVQEVGWDEDTDDDLRLAIEERVGSPLEDEDFTGEVDVALLWWRRDDGDLADALVDLVVMLSDGGFVLLLTPTPRTGNAVDAAEVEEAASTAGLHASASFAAAAEWRAVRLVAPKASKAPVRR